MKIKFTIFTFLLLNVHSLFSQFGRVITGNGGTDYLMDLGARPKSLNEKISIDKKFHETYDSNYYYYSHQLFEMRTNQNNTLFYVFGKKLLDAQYNVVSDSIIETKGSNGAPLIVMQFKNHGYKFIGINVDERNYDSLHWNKVLEQKIDALNPTKIRVNQKSQFFQFDNFISDYTYTRKNDSTYILLIAESKFIHCFEITYWSNKYLGKLVATKVFNFIDTSNFNGKKVLNTYINKIDVSHNSKYLIIRHQEWVSERVKITPIFYSLRTTRIATVLTFLNIDLKTLTIGQPKIVAVDDYIPGTPKIGYLPETNVVFDPLNQFFYYSLSYKAGFDSNFLYRYSISTNEKELVFTAQKSFALSLHLTYWGSIFVPFAFNRTSKLCIISNPSSTLSQLKISTYDEPKPYSYYYVGTYITPFVHNYLYIEPEIRQECKSRVKFHNKSNIARGFTRFEYHLATDTVGKNWKILQEFEPEYIYKTAGKYAYKVRGFCDDGYSEWYEDSIIIEFPEQFDVLATDTPKFNYATVTSNKQIDINWAPLSGAYEYEVYKNNLFLANTKDTKFTDTLNQEVEKSFKYQLVAVDGCLHKSANSKTVETIFLTASKDNSSAVQLQAAELEWNAYKNGTETATSYQIESAFFESNSWQMIHLGTPLNYRDNQFVNFGKEGKCYRIQGQLLGGFKSQSNEVCIPYNELVYIPSAFTPNGDGLNDAFEVHGNGISNVEMSIYNRWGEKIFTAEGKNTQWIPSNELLSNQAYQYIIRCSYSNGNWDVFKGSVMVLN